jgi:hypothetical protein
VLSVDLERDVFEPGPLARFVQRNGMVIYSHAQIARLCRLLGKFEAQDASIIIEHRLIILGDNADVT